LQFAEQLVKVVEASLHAVLMSACERILDGGQGFHPHRNNLR